MSPLDTPVRCCGCGLWFPTPDNPALVEENSCEWHQLWAPVGEDVVDGEIVLGLVPASDEPNMALVPYSPGEILNLGEMTFEQLGRVLDEAREFEKAGLRQFKTQLTAEILRRMDARAAAGEDGAWTIHADGMEITGASPGRTDYDLDELRRALKGLVDAKRISKEAMDKCIVPDGWKVAKRPLAQLAKVGKDVKAAIDACEHPSTKPRYVTVKLAVSR